MDRTISRPFCQCVCKTGSSRGPPAPRLGLQRSRVSQGLNDTWGGAGQGRGPLAGACAQYVGFGRSRAWLLTGLLTSQSPDPVIMQIC